MKSSKSEKTYSIGVSKDNYERIKRLADESGQTLGFVSDALLGAALDAMYDKFQERIEKLHRTKRMAEDNFRDELLHDLKSVNKA